MHWVCAVIFMQPKRIQFYDSMGSGGENYLLDLFRYLQDEHQDKKGCPLPDPSRARPTHPASTMALTGMSLHACFATFSPRTAPLSLDRNTSISAATASGSPFSTVRPSCTVFLILYSFWTTNTWGKVATALLDK